MNKFINIAYKFRGSSKTLKIQKSVSLLRSLYTGKNVCAKSFMEFENRYAFKIMQNSGYVSSLDKGFKKNCLSAQDFDKILQEDWSRKSPQNLFQTFSLLGPYAVENGLCITDKRFDLFIDNLTDNVKLASDYELQDLFYSLANWPPAPLLKSRNHIEVWVALDDECMKRIKDWSIDKLFIYLSLFFLINASKNSEFCTKALNRLATKPERLTNDQLVQTLYFIGVQRKAPFDILRIEDELGSKFEEFSIDDLAIMSMGFFKSKTPIRNTKTVLKIIEKIKSESRTIHEVSLASLLKIIRLSNNFKLEQEVYGLLEVLQEEVPRLSLMCGVHVALVGTTALVLHKRCLDKIAENTASKIRECRIKDLERLVMTFAMFNYKPQIGNAFFDKALEDLRNPDRNAEFDKYHQSFSCCVSYLCQLQIMPEDLIQKVLDPANLEKHFKKNYGGYGREIFHLNNVAEIYFNDRELPKLSQKVCRVLAQRYTDFVPSEEYKKQYNVMETIMLDMMRILKEIRGGSQYVMADHILAHHQRGDIILCDDKEGCPVPVQQFPNARFGEVIRPPNNNTWIVLIIAGRNAFVKNTGTPTGPFVSKERDLRQIGYYPVLVNVSNWSDLRSQGEKHEYLKAILKNVYDSNSIRRISVPS